jgi:hypothetical protein
VDILLALALAGLCVVFPGPIFFAGWLSCLGKSPEEKRREFKTAAKFSRASVGLGVLIVVFVVAYTGFTGCRAARTKKAHAEEVQAAADTVEKERVFKLEVEPELLRRQRERLQSPK